MEINKNELNFTKDENKTRKIWLILSIIIPLVVVIGCVICLGIFYGYHSNYASIAGMLAYVAFVAFWNYIGYYCAYKKPGTIFLLIGMVLFSINLLMDLFKLENVASLNTSRIFVLSLVFLYKMSILYYSYELLKINKKMQERILTTAPVYINALSVFSTVTTLDELNARFAELKSEDDSGSTVQILTKAYDHQKKMYSL